VQELQGIKLIFSKKGSIQFHWGEEETMLTTYGEGDVTSGKSGSRTVKKGFSGDQDRWKGSKK